MKISFSELSVYEVENFQKAILKEIESSKTSFTLNFCDVEKIDFSNIQLLLSLKNIVMKKILS